MSFKKLSIIILILSWFILSGFNPSIEREATDQEFSPSVGFMGMLVGTSGQSFWGTAAALDLSYPLMDHLESGVGASGSLATNQNFSTAQRNLYGYVRVRPVIPDKNLGLGWNLDFLHSRIRVEDETLAVSYPGTSLYLEPSRSNRILASFYYPLSEEDEIENYIVQFGYIRSPYETASFSYSLSLHEVGGEAITQVAAGLILNL